ncbi:Trehalose 6-phosphate phosphorylase [Balamuthia mandrillaris]
MNPSEVAPTHLNEPARGLLFKAVVFDLDGVVTKTAHIHCQAWKQMFDEFFEWRVKEGIDSGPPRKFTDEDYKKYVDGIPRDEGVKNYLRQHGITLPDGSPKDSLFIEVNKEEADPNEDQTTTKRKGQNEEHRPGTRKKLGVQSVASLGNWKNDLFNQKLEEQGAEVYQSTVDLIKELHKRSIKTAVASSSKNCSKILRSVGYQNLFEASMDGQLSESLGLKGKPAPDIFLECCRLLGIPPHKCVLVEDAVQGVQAGVNGSFGMVVGLDRGNNRLNLLEAGANLVLDDFAGVTPEILNDFFPFTDPGWTMTFDGFVPAQQKLREALCTLGNGYFTTRGAFEEARSGISAAKTAELAGESLNKDLEDLDVHYPGTYIAGGYNRAKSVIDGVTVENEDLVNWPDWTHITFRSSEQGRWFDWSLEHFDIMSCNQILNVRDGLLCRQYRVREKQSGHITTIRSQRMVNMRKTHLGTIKYNIMPENWSGNLQVLSGIDGTVENWGVPRYRQLASKHWNIIERGELDTRQTRHVSGICRSVEKRLQERYLKNIDASGSKGVDKEAPPRGGEVGQQREPRERTSLTPATTTPSPDPALEAETRASALEFGSAETQEIMSEIAEHRQHVDSLASLATSHLQGELEIDTENGQFVSQESMLHNQDDREQVKAKGIYLGVRTLQSHLEVAMSSFTRVYYCTNCLSWIGPNECKKQLVGLEDDSSYVGERFDVMATQGKAITVEKIVAIASSRDKAISNPVDAVIESIKRCGLKRFIHLQSTHEINWNSIWRRCSTHVTALAPQKVGGEEEDIKIETDDYLTAPPFVRRLSMNVAQPPPTTSSNSEDVELSLDESASEPSEDDYDPHLYQMPQTNEHTKMLERYQQNMKQSGPSEEEQLGGGTIKMDFRPLATDHLQFLLRMHMYHLIQTVSHNSIGRDVGIPARGLHGESYRGHIFWDELYLMPFYNLGHPEISRELLLYRYHRLDAARDHAKNLGYFGACYPWQSGSSGREESQQLHYNPLSHTWGPDYSSLQLHINIAVFFNYWNYINVSGDMSFLELYGAEVMLEIARFWGLRAEFNETTARYEINGVMGPDEYHEKYPDTSRVGVDNNAYTNIMVVWCLDIALRVLNFLSHSRRRELQSKLHLHTEELNRWKHIIKRMTVPFHDGCIISQFSGYEKLKELDWKAYRNKYPNIRRMDRILKAEGDSPDRYKVSKQADVCMLFYLLSPEEFMRIMHRLGYSFDRSFILKNIEYYLARTSHGSTLSLVVYSHVLHEFDIRQSWNTYCEFLLSDVCDSQEGTTQEGIHLVPMAASVNMLIFRFCGIDTTRNAIRFAPKLPQGIKHLCFRFQYQKQWLQVRTDHHTLKVKNEEESGEKIPVLVKEHLYYIFPGSTMQFSLAD